MFRNFRSRTRLLLHPPAPFVFGIRGKCLRVQFLQVSFPAIAILLLAVPTSGAVQSAPEGGTAVQESARLRQADAAFHAGYAAYAKGDLRAALVDFQRVVHLVPNLEEGHSALGAVFVQLGDSSKAIPELLKSLALKPADHSALLNLAMAYEQNAQYSKAILIFQRMVRESGSDAQHAPMPPDAAMAYARSLDAVHRSTEAIAVLQREVDGGQNMALLHDELGSLYAQQKRWAEAKDEFKQAISLDSNDGSAHLRLGTVLLADGQPQDALQELELATKLLPQSSQAELELGNAWLSVGEDEKAIPFLQHAVASDPASVEAKYRLAIALQGADHEKQAIPFFREVLAAQPSNVTAMTDLGLALVQTGNAKEAIGLYRNAIGLDRKNPTIYQDLGAAYLQESDMDDAISSFKTGIEMIPQDAQLHYDLGLAYKLKDDVSAAMKELELASGLDPELSEPHYTLGILNMQEGHFDEAEKQLEIALRMRPQNPDGWSILGSVYRQQNKLPQAVKALNESIRQQPDQPSGYITLASILAQQGNHTEAATYRKKAADLMRLAANRQRAMFATNAGNILLGKGQIKQALDQYQEAIRDDPKYADAYRGLAAVLDKQGKSDEAAAARRNAAALPSPNR